MDVFVLGRKLGHKIRYGVFSGKMAAAGDDGQLVSEAGAAGVVPARIGSSLVFCNVWLFMCVWLRGVLEPVLADRSVMAA